VEVYNGFLNSKSKGAKKKKHKKEICPNHKMFEKKQWTPPIFSNPISSSFFVYVNLKSWGFAKWSSSNSKGNKAMSKKFKLKITNCFNEPIILNPLTSNTYIFLILKIIIFMVIGAPSGGL
jgi:hypothetical protein